MPAEIGLIMNCWSMVISFVSFEISFHFAFAFAAANELKISLLSK